MFLFHSIFFLCFAVFHFPSERRKRSSLLDQSKSLARTGGRPLFAIRFFFGCLPSFSVLDFKISNVICILHSLNRSIGESTSQIKQDPRFIIKISLILRPQSGQIEKNEVFKFFRKNFRLKLSQKIEKFLKKKVRDTLFKWIFGTNNLLELKNSTAYATPNSMNRATGENWSQIE